MKTLGNIFGAILIVIGFKTLFDLGSAWHTSDGKDMTFAVGDTTFKT